MEHLRYGGLHSGFTVTTIEINNLFKIIAKGHIRISWVRAVVTVTLLTYTAVLQLGLCSFHKRRARIRKDTS